MTFLIVNADDYGADPDIDRGIVEAFEHGILTSTTLLVASSPDWEKAALRAKSIGLPMGLHLSLTQGHPVAPREIVPDLVDAEGRLALSAGRLVGMSWQSEKQHAKIYDQIRTELNAQIGLLRDRGFELTHLDSHQHFHMNPVIFRIAEELANRNGIGSMRFVREPFFGFHLYHRVLPNLRRLNQIKGALLALQARRITPNLRTNDAFYGVLQSGNVDKWSFIRLLRKIAGSDRVWEVGIHPGFPADEIRPSHAEFGPWFTSLWRKRELDLLVDPDVRAALQKERIELTSYASLKWT
jgi:chitin disaccharide deacetylase